MRSGRVVRLALLLGGLFASVLMAAAGDRARAQEEAEARDLKKPRIRIPLLMNLGAWNWVEEITRRLTKVVGKKLDLPSLEDRLILAGKKPGITPKFPSDKDREHITLFLVQMPEANAFATSNRRIYVTRGLLEFVRSDDELAGVLAHEIGHLVGGHHRHLARKQSLLAALGTIGGALMKKGAAGILAGQAFGRAAGLTYNREAENDADRRGLLMVKTAGYHPVGMLHFMERLASESGNDLDDPLSVFFSTHPPTKKRANRFRKAVAAEGGLRAPGGLSYDFRRALYSPRLAKSLGRGKTTTGSQAASAKTTDRIPGLRVPFLLGKDFQWAEPTPFLTEDPKDAHRVSFRGWAPLPEDYERTGGTVIPGADGLLMNPGTVLRGPLFNLEPSTSYILAARMAARGKRIRAFVGLELEDGHGSRLGEVYPAAPGIFLDGGEKRVAGVTHPFSRLEAAQGRETPVKARLIVKTGRRGDGQLVLRKVACLPVGRTPVMPVDKGDTGGALPAP